MDASEDSNISDPPELCDEPQKILMDSFVEQSNFTSQHKKADNQETLNPILDPDIEDEITDCNEDEELSEKKSKTAGGFTGRGVTLQMLLEDNILKPKEGAMSLEYMGQKFNGDLLADGKIFSAEVQEAFTSPSAWALRCKQIVNPEQKYGCGWSSVRYFGKPLDVYKNQWMRKRRLGQSNSDNLAIEDGGTSAFNQSMPNEGEPESELELKENIVAINRKIVKHETLGNRSSIDDPHLLVETSAFTNMGKLQPFLVSINISALVVMEFHCSLTCSEVTGYLAGIWDMNANTLSVKEAFPYISKSIESKACPSTEVKIAQSMETLGLSLVGWYHSHPLVSPTPTVQDIDVQLENQLRLKGTGDQGYRPCIAMISSPFYQIDDPNETHLLCYWVSPPTESRPLELGRPMTMQYNIIFDSSCKDDLASKLVNSYFIAKNISSTPIEQGSSKFLRILNFEKKHKTEKYKFIKKWNPVLGVIGSFDKFIGCAMSAAPVQ
uniref:EOG090X020Z n=1 Tax=Scapholeberis mucronata TaxID=202097 RepID=A0A4Y7NLL1_9CRUS|nr:EOG090X020Z [Scapholeberis mucronata]SVE93477.1 EOG090X020Z [Scapholeberis mucronata]